MNNKFFSIEVFPKIGSSFICVKGSIKFSFNNEEYFLIGSDQPVGLQISNGTSGSGGLPNYHSFRLITPKDRTETNPFEKAEVVCDIISMSTKNHVRYLSPLFNEYYFNAGWSSGEEFKVENISNSIVDYWGEYVFLDYDLLKELLSKLGDSKDQKKTISLFPF